MDSIWSTDEEAVESTRSLPGVYKDTIYLTKLLYIKSQTNQDTCDGFHLYSAFTHLHLHHAHAHSHLLLIVFLPGSFEL